VTSALRSRRVRPRLFAAVLVVLALGCPIGGATIAAAAPASRPLNTPSASDPGTLDPPDPYYPSLGNRGYDAEHYDLAVAYDPKSGELRGDATIRAHATGALRRFDLDLIGFDVSRVTVDGKPARSSRTDTELRVRPRTPIAKGSPFTVRVRYAGVPSAGQIPGVGAPNGWLVTNDGAATLGEPDGSRRWFPGNDHPSDKATFTFSVTVPTPLVAVANGVLEGKVANGDQTVWTWNETAPMTTYLAQLAIGDYELRDEPAVDGVAIRNALTPDVADRAGTAASATPEMLRFLSSWFGKYPFSTYGIIVPDGGPRGIAFEAQTFSIVAADLFRDPSVSSAILAHELAHQWFGDWVSPATWDETWLNEGFATYAEWLWEDHAVGVPLAGEVERAISAVNRSPGIATDDPGIDEMFGYAPYERGALTLHALRLEVGDATFAEILRTYLDRFGGKTATTEDFVRVANQVAGRNLTPFLRPWLGPGPLPELPETITPVGSDAPTAVTVAAP
jgi:aminopeptidase N